MNNLDDSFHQFLLEDNPSELMINEDCGRTWEVALKMIF